MRRFSLLSVLVVAALLDQWSAAAAPMITLQATAVIPESVEGLQAQLETILNAAKNHDSRYHDLIASLKLPDGTDWFSATFGEEAGGSVAANYRSSWEVYKNQVSRIFQETSKTKLKQVAVKAYSAGSPSTRDSFLQAVLKDVKNTAVFYTAAVVKGRETSVLPGIYLYVQGAFRVVNWASFYGLPNVKPVRIRVGTSVAMSQLIHQVNPTMSAEARQQHLQGSVVLHIVIDCDGNVAQAQIVSGPELLAKAAVEAVRQWQFKPTVLSGDPVEVDTTVEIIFSLNR